MKKVYNFSKIAHEGQKRKSWEPYFLHPLMVWINLWTKFQDINLFAAWLLHDTVEDSPNIEMQDIYEQFWEEIGYIVDAASKNVATYHNSNLTFDRKIDKLIYGWMRNIKCFLVKIADRNDNLQTLQNLKNNKQVRMAFETQAIFSPLETVFDYHNINSLNEAEDNFNIVIQRNNIKGSADFKNYLTQKTFKNFSNECFDSVYQNSNNVTWKITNKDTFRDFIQITDIEQKIELHSMESNELWEFLATFTFLKWEIIENISLSIWDTYSFSNT